VAIGMALVARLSEALDYCTGAVCDRLYAVLEALELPVTYTALDSQDLLEIMAHDKKTVNGVMRFILLQDIGSVVYRQEVPLDTLQELLAQYA
jgi:3-dehydroquinate synthase